MKKNSNKRIIGYCRESTAIQYNEGFNIDDQEKRIKSYVEIYYDGKNNNLTIMRDAASAKSLDRPKMNDVLQMIKEHQVDVFIVYSLDRMTRRVKDLAYLLDVFQKNHVQLLSITEKIDTDTPMGRFFIYLIVLIAQWEQETIGSRSTRGIIESAMQGNYALPGSPIGYMRDPKDNHKLIIKKDSAKVVKRVFSEVADNGTAITSIVHILNSENALDRKWNRDTLTNLVNNKIYYGTMVLRGEEFPNIAPPLITKETYKLAQLRIKATKHVKGHHYLFRSFVRCTKCNRIMGIRTMTPKSGKVYKYYLCGNCLQQIPEKEIIEQVNDEFTEIMRKEQFDEDVHALEASYSDAAETIQSLPMSFFIYGLDREYVEGLIDQKTEDRNTIKKNIDRLQAGLLEITFKDLSYSQVFDFMHKYVRTIDVNLDTYAVSVVYKTESMDA